MDLIHLVDFNVELHSHDKRYTEDYMRCEDAERCLRFIQAQLEKYNLLPNKPELIQFEQEAEHSMMSHRQLLPVIEDVDAQLHQRIQSTQQLESQQKQLSLSLTETSSVCTSCTRTMSDAAAIYATAALP